MSSVQTLEEMHDTRFYSVKDVAEATGLPRPMIYRLASDGRLRRAPNLGGTVRFLGMEVKRFVREAEAVLGAGEEVNR